MRTFSRMLVAVDGSEPAESAIRLALRLAAGPDRALRFVTVFDREKLIVECTAATAYPVVDLGAVLDSSESASRSFIDDASAIANSAQIESTGTVRIGHVVDSILDEARAWNASSIVVGTHGRRGIARAFLGSTAEGVLRNSNVPVLLAHASDDRAPLTHILCALDDSPAARHAFHTALDVAIETHGIIEVVSIVNIDDTYASGFENERFDPDGSMTAIYAEARARAQDLAVEARLRGVTATAHIHGGADVAALIIEIGRRLHCGLTVIGTHGRNGLRRAFLGSTAEAVIRSSAVPVLALRDPSDVSATVKQHAAGSVAR